MSFSTQVSVAILIGVSLAQSAFAISCYQAVSTTAAVRAEASGANRGNIVRRKNMHELLRENANHKDIQEAYEHDKADLENSVRTGAGGSPEWHLHFLNKTWAEYNQARNTSTIVNISPTGAAFAHSIENNTSKMVDLIKAGAPYAEVQRAYFDELGTLDWLIHGEGNKSLIPALNQLRQTWYMYSAYKAPL